MDKQRTTPSSLNARYRDAGQNINQRRDNQQDNDWHHREAKAPKFEADKHEYGSRDQEDI